MYKSHKQKGAGFYLKSRSDVVRLISCLPKSNKGMKDDYLIASGPWHDSLPCPTQLGEPVGYLRFRFSNIRFKLFVLGFVLLYIIFLGIITVNPHVVRAKITLPTRGLKSVT